MGYICFPDEKGTESVTVRFFLIVVVRYICFPDEKGTERLPPFDEGMRTERLHLFPR